MRVVAPKRPSVVTRSRLLGLAAIFSVTALVCVAPAACGVAPTASALLLAPAFLLFAVLLLGGAPGALLLERMRARRFARRAPRAPRALTMRRPILVRRTASPATSALAMRPPPVLAAVIG
jgi:hypothetical protein